MAIEFVVLNYLLSTLGLPVYLEVPEKPPARFVLVEKTGSGVENRITSAMLAIQSYAETMAEAVKLNEQVKAAMENIVELDSVSACRLNSDYNYTDTDKKGYRYQAVFDLVHY